MKGLKFFVSYFLIVGNVKIGVNDANKMMKCDDY